MLRIFQTTVSHSILGVHIIDYKTNKKVQFPLFSNKGYKKHLEQNPRFSTNSYPLLSCLQSHYHTENNMNTVEGFFAFSRYLATHTKQVKFVHYEKRTLWIDGYIYTQFHSRHVYPVLLQKFFNPKWIFTQSVSVNEPQFISLL